MNRLEMLAQSEETREKDLPLEEEAWRAGVWAMLGTLLMRVPDEETLRRVAAFLRIDGRGTELQMALRTLGLAAEHCSPASVDDEFHDLFIGIGRGELLPYGSWYQTGFLMERPLSMLRETLAELGYRREETVKEPEDHVAALCEVMALLIGDDVPLSRQAEFFQEHVDGWMERFFEDLEGADSAIFYRSVGRMGKAFVRFERGYLRTLNIQSSAGARQ